ncbi:hypothetical protein PybrP1_011998 [[Pythium] brassicae (nom. inval.)]|nr:hypothetical protein PybrP1_011998 [[Pythium] brassicae (nom. inval.)]
MASTCASGASLASLSSQRKRAPKATGSAQAPVSAPSASDDDYLGAGDDDDDDALDALLSDEATQAAAAQQLQQRRRLRARRRFGACHLTLRGALLGGCGAWLLAALVWLRWPLYLQLLAEPLEKALGAKLRAEVEPLAVIYVLALPFALVGVLFYALERVDRSDDSAGGDWRNAKWVLWLRRQRREHVGLALDTVDVAAVALFVLVQLNCFILSILLVSRQSFVHKLLGLSSERAARYHVWTGNFGVFALVLHGVLYSVYWLQRGELRANLLPCIDCSSVLAYKTTRNFAGLVALLVLLLVALGSVEWMRRRHFRRFSLVHCANVLFVAASCVHYYPAAFWLVPSVLVYVVYRVRSFVGQGQATVLSAASLSDKIVQLELKRAGGGGTHDFAPGQYVYIKVDEISRVEWHPFTISSSPLRNRHALHLDAKVHSRFTRRVLAMVKAHRLTSVKVDGYYGDPIRPCAHMVFVAGGSGATPFLSFLEHLVLRAEQERLDAASPLSSSSSASTVSTVSTAAASSASDIDGAGLALFPETIWVVWTCRDVALLEAHAELLQSVKKSARWKTNVWLHLTPSPTEEEEEDDDSNEESGARVERFFPASMQRHAFAGGATHAAPLATFVGASVGLALAMHAVYTADESIGRVWWLKRVLLLAASVVGAAAGGGAVLFMVKQVSGRGAQGQGRGAGSAAATELEFEAQELASPSAPATPRKHGGGGLAASALLQRSFSVSATRPDVRQRLRGIHSELQENFGMGADVGLFVSGPASLQADVAHHARALHAPLLAVHVKAFSV